jgi:hypothetical protein
MASTSRAGYCLYCGHALEEGDQFCGSCGTAVLSSPPPAEQVIPQQEAASRAPSRGRRSPWVLAISAIAVLLLGFGTLLAVVFQNGSGTFGRIGSAAEEGSSTIRDKDLVLQFASEYRQASERENWSATYAMLAETSQSEFSESEWIEKQEVRESIEGSPPPVESILVDVDDQQADPIVIVDFNFEDGTTMTLNIIYSEESNELRRLLTEDYISHLDGLSEDDSAS